MQNKSISIIVGILLILVLGAFFFFQNKEDAPMVNSPTDNEADVLNNDEVGVAAGSATPNFEGLTAQVVAEHDTTNDCWTIVNGSVYDITSWIAENQSLSAQVIPFCGKDATAAYNANAQGSVLAAETLALYRIGAFVR